jgi:hypothetical protein
MDISTLEFVKGEIGNTVKQPQLDASSIELQSCELLLVGGGIGDVVPA